MLGCLFVIASVALGLRVSLQSANCVVRTLGGSFPKKSLEHPPPAASVALWCNTLPDCLCALSRQAIRCPHPTTRKEPGKMRVRRRRRMKTPSLDENPAPVPTVPATRAAPTQTRTTAAVSAFSPSTGQGAQVCLGCTSAWLRSLDSKEAATLPSLLCPSATCGGIVKLHTFV